MPATLTAPSIAEYKTLLEREGPAGLAYLNGRVPHRYTGVFRLQDGQMRNAFLYDKQGEIVPDFLEVVPLQESFCQFTLKEGLFVTCDSGGDARLAGHKYQGVLLSYCGLPLVDNFGGLYGTICHFDAQAMELPEAEFAFFRQAARVLPAYLGKRAL